MKKLSIPENISLDQEFIPGIGKQELPRLLIAVVPGLILLVVIYWLVHSPGIRLLIMVCGMGYLGLSYIFVARVEKNQSIYTFIARTIRFWRSQKKFYYKQEKEVMYRVEETC